MERRQTWVGTETIPGRGVRYLARARQHDAQPHTVITPDLSELRAALEAGSHSQPSREKAGSPSRRETARPHAAVPGPR